MEGPRRQRIILASVWVGIVILACLRSYALVHYDRRASVPITPEAVRVAYMLRTQGNFANPFTTFPTGPTAHVAPGFPAILAAIYWVFGTGAMGAFVPKLLEATILVIQVTLLPLVATALGVDRKTGLLAALLAVGGLRHTFLWEANYVGLLLILATLLAYRYVVILEAS